MVSLHLKKSRIDDLVRDLELSELGNHIAATLRDLTNRKRKDVARKTTNYLIVSSTVTILIKHVSNSGETAQEALKPPPLMPNLVPAVQPGQNHTPPESLSASTIQESPTLEMELSMGSYPFCQTSDDVWRSLAEDYAVPCNNPFNSSTSNLPIPPTTSP